MENKDTDHLVQHLSHWTDYDFCKNFYSKNKLFVNNLFGTMNKIGEFKIIYGTMDSIKRCNLYKSRGFTFTNLDKLSYNEISANSNLKFIFKKHTSKYLYKSVPKNIKEITIIHKDEYHNYQYPKACVRTSKNEKECYADSCLIKLCNLKLPHQHYYRIDTNFSSNDTHFILPDFEWIYIDADKPNDLLKLS